jgi:hypothetical protein
MGFLDDLDQAFTDMMEKTGADNPEAPSTVGEIQEAVQRDLDRLESDIAEESLVAVYCIVKNLEVAKRYTMLSALAGAIRNGKKAKAARATEMDRLSEIIHTKTGVVRQKLSGKQMKEFLEITETFPTPQEEMAAELIPVLEALDQSTAWSSEDIQALYEAGICHRSQLEDGNQPQLAQITGLPRSHFTILMAKLP